MTTSIQELKKDLLEETVPLSILLRKAILVARALKDNEIEKWIQVELNGYQVGDKAPEYRILSGQPMFLNPYAGWQMLLLKGDNPTFERLVTSVPTFAPISEVENHAKETDVRLQYGHELEKLFQSQTNMPGKPALAVHGSEFRKVLTTVRNKLFDWVSSLPDDEVVQTIPVSEEPMTIRKGWNESVESHPMRYAIVIVIATAVVVAGIMGWIQKEREDNLINRYETEKLVIKNEYEAQIRNLKAQIEELQKQRPALSSKK